MAELFNNLARSTLASGITAGALSLTVQSGDGNDLFPVIAGSDNFRCVLFKKSTGDIEIINVTAKTADVFTITRAQEQIGNLAATAFAFDAGDLIELRPTGAFFNSLAVGASSTNIQQGVFIYGVDTGAADVYTVAMTPTATALADGQEVRVKIGAANTNTGILPSLQLDALPAKNIVLQDGSTPPAGSIVGTFIHTFTYDGTRFIFKPSGIVLTSTGYNAVGKQIKNVAAGTDASDAATIGLAEALALKTLISPVINTGVSGTAGVSRMILESPIVTTSGTSVDITGIPSWAKKINVCLNGVSTNGTSNIVLQIGDSVGIETTGYYSICSFNLLATNTTTESSTAFIIAFAPLAAGTLSGATILTLANSTTNAWLISGNNHQPANALHNLSGNKSLSDTLTQMRLTTAGGTDIFDAGEISISYEG